MTYFKEYFMNFRMVAVVQKCATTFYYVDINAPNNVTDQERGIRACSPARANVLLLGIPARNCVGNSVEIALLGN